MLNGFGAFEILTVFVIILLFFGSKEMPSFLIRTAKFFGRIRRYSNSFQREIRNIYEESLIEEETPEDDISKRKRSLRKEVCSSRDGLSHENKERLSEEIRRNLYITEEYKESKALMLYYSVGNEADTEQIIRDSLQEGKRVILPYITSKRGIMGIAEIEDIYRDTVTGKYGIPEPIEGIRDNFLKSDLDLVICPGVVFDRYGNRIGFGGGYYDRFLEELKGRIPVFAIAYQFQVRDDHIPSYYHDIQMDEIITENGLQLS
ncbi:MAG: 5-formyltetrahydrofolate cyclo-ligase [Chitinivibrionales bacterium]